MDNSFFNVEISIQGDSAVNLLDITKDWARYEVVGFEEQQIVIIDYRKDILQVLQDCIDNDRIDEFAPVFNTPALLTIQEDDRDNLLIELEEPADEEPDHMMWIAIGIQDSIPMYEYLYEYIVPLNEESFAFFSIFRIPFLKEVSQYQHDSDFQHPMHSYK